MNKAQQELQQVPEELSLEQRIMRGLDAQGVPYGERAIADLVEYLKLLQEWNKTHNLTAVHDIEDMLGVHLFDSTSIKPYIRGSSLLDVGSGAGLPGMIWAILSPALQVTSVESRNKKAQFQMYVSNQLKLKNLTVLNMRIEDFDPKEKFAMVVARAFSSIEDLIEGSKQAIAPNGRWLAMKGAIPLDELKILKKLNLKYDTYALNVPELDADRNLVVIQAGK